MLQFDRHPAWAPSAFADHVDPTLGYLMPSGLALAESPNAVPAFTMLRYAAGDGRTTGGVLQAAFEPRTPDVPIPQGARLTPAPAAQGELRLTLRTSAAARQRASQWTPVSLANGRAVSQPLHFDRSEAVLFEALTRETTDTLSAELQLQTVGLRRGPPADARLDVARVDRHLRRRLGDRPVTSKDILPVVLELAVPDAVTFQPRSGGPAGLPGTDALLREAAAWAQIRLFEPEPRSDGARLRYTGFPHGQTRAVWPLDLNRRETRAVTLDWSISAWWQGLPPAEIERHFPQGFGYRPVGETAVHMFNAVPLHPQHVREARLDVRWTSARGVPEHATVKFTPDGPATHRLPAHFLTGPNAFGFETRASVLLSPPSGRGWPRPWPRRPDFAPVGETTVYTLTPAEIGLRVTELSVEPAAFAACAGVRFRLWRGDAAGPADATVAEWEATAADPRAPLALTDAGTEPLFVHASAVPPAGHAGAEATLLAGPLTADRLTVTLADVQPAGPERVSVRLDPATAATTRLAFVEIRTAPGGSGARMLRLPLDEPIEVPVWQRSIFDPLAYAWRLTTVKVDAEGRTEPMATGPWHDTGARDLKVGA